MEWKISTEPVEYPAAMETMERRVAGIAAGTAPEMAWLLEHPPLYTAGTSAKAPDLLDSARFPVYPSGRGGQFTYHGPGQRVAYLMLDLRKRALPGQPDIRRYVRRLEQWLIATLAEFGVEGFTREGRTGVWVSDKGGEAKIAAIGIRVRKWVAYHGISLNVSPDLSHYSGIVPCGIREHSVTSLAAIGIETCMNEVDTVLNRTFMTTFEAETV
ncbi:MAG: lipoyl(octanoyl) transferase LipB [Pseudomonadota bacterium]|nr:lipoyl(octanoyl) transferase LipB [Pseudomonadota bacterium]